MTTSAPLPTIRPEQAARFRQMSPETLVELQRQLRVDVIPALRVVRTTLTHGHRGRAIARLASLQMELEADSLAIHEAMTINAAAAQQN